MWLAVEETLVDVVNKSWAPWCAGFILLEKYTKSTKGLQNRSKADKKPFYLPGNLLVFLFQNDFFGLPDSNVTSVGSSAPPECSIELNCVPSAITRSFAASLIFTIKLDYPPISDQLRKNRFSFKVTEAKGKEPISLNFVSDPIIPIWSKRNESQEPPSIWCGHGHICWQVVFCFAGPRTWNVTCMKTASLPVTILNHIFFFFFFSFCLF